MRSGLRRQRRRLADSSASEPNAAAEAAVARAEVTKGTNGERSGRHLVPPPRSAARRALKRRFPRLARVALAALDPIYRLRFRFQYKPDRRVLEEVIFPALLADERVRRVLFVGCAWYTRDYAERFHDREFWTIDVDERVARYAGERHVIASVTTIGDHFQPESLDVVICNGVIGFGLDTEQDCDRAFDAAYKCLRPGGLLIIGWDDTEGFRPPVSLENLASLRGFQPFVLTPFASWRYPTFGPLRHTFDFYIRPTDGRSGR